MEIVKRPGQTQDIATQPQEVATVAAPPAQAIGPEQLLRFTQVLEKYKSGKAQTENRIISSENWWKTAKRLTKAVWRTVSNLPRKDAREKFLRWKAV